MKTKFPSCLGLISSAAVLTLALGIGSNTLAQNAPPTRPQQNAPRGVFIQRLEAQLGRPLSAQQRQQLGGASRETMESLRAAQGTFIQRISQITGVSVAQIREMVPQIGQPNEGFDKNMIPKIEAVLGRSLTPEQLTQIRAVDQEKRAAMLPIQERFAQRVSQITGLSTAQIQGMLPRIGL